MEQIRYTGRICTDPKRIEGFLRHSRAGIVGISAGEYPYAVPVNFVWMDGCVYFHGMGSGKKVRLLEEHPKVCFTVYEEAGTVTDPVPCKVDTAYMSVMLFGTAQRVEDFEESAAALQQLLHKFMPGFFKQMPGSALIEKYRSALDDNPVAVYKIRPDFMTAKENRSEPEALFSGGSET